MANEWCDILINWPNCLFDTKGNNTLDAYWLKFLTKLQCTKTTSTDSKFGAFSSSLSWSTYFYVLPNHFIVSVDHNFSL